MHLLKENSTNEKLENELIRINVKRQFQKLHSLQIHTNLLQLQIHLTLVVYGVNVKTMLNLLHFSFKVQFKGIIVSSVYDYL